jgi:hypothetical protein
VRAFSLDRALLAPCDLPKLFHPSHDGKAVSARLGKHVGARGFDGTRVIVLFNRVCRGGGTTPAGSGYTSRLSAGSEESAPKELTPPPGQSRPDRLIRESLNFQNSAWRVSKEEKPQRVIAHPPGPQIVP